MLLEKRNYYKPFIYPWAYELWQQHEKMHWLPQEVNLLNDVNDWHKRTSDDERELLTRLFRFFTQADVDVASGYTKLLLPRFWHPEIVMMLSSFAAREAIHMAAYSHLIDTLGIPEREYAAFTRYEAMCEKHDYVADYLRSDDVAQLALGLAVFSAFTEGVQLFSSFAILLHFSRTDDAIPQHKRGRYTGMGQIVSWSVRDESVHVEGNIKLFRQLMQENPGVWTDGFRGQVYQACRDMVDLEDAFVDLMFDGVRLDGLTADDVKRYVRFVADKRLMQLGLKQNWGIECHPISWMDIMLSAVEHANFFEVRATEYTKGGLTGTWKDVWGCA